MFGVSQPYSLKEDVKPVKLELHKFNPSSNPKAKGSLNITNVTQVKDTLYYFVSGISIYSPVYVIVSSKEADKKLDIRLCKMNWNNPDRSGSTNSSGIWSDKFKTETDFGIMVIAREKPSDYSLMVWVGDEAKFELPTVFSGKENEEKGDSEKGNFLKENALYIVIGLLVLIIGILFIKLKKNKNETKS